MRQVALIVLTREVGKIPTTQRKILRHKQSPTAISHLYLVTTYLITKHNLPPLNTTNLSRPSHQMILKHLQLNDALILNLSCAKKFIEDTFSDVIHQMIVLYAPTKSRRFQSAISSSCAFLCHSVFKFEKSPTFNKYYLYLYKFICIHPRSA